jgi:hypothetical protein
VATVNDFDSLIGFLLALVLTWCIGCALPLIRNLFTWHAHNGPELALLLVLEVTLWTA